jgi:ABC-type uncharacterized transport system ATPase subunit
MSTLSLKKLCTAINDNDIIEDDFEISSGEIVCVQRGIYGVLMGYQKPISGAICFNEERLFSVEDRKKFGVIGVSLDTVPICPNDVWGIIPCMIYNLIHFLSEKIKSRLTIEDAIYCELLVNKRTQLGREEIFRMVRDITDAYGLSCVAHRKIYELSSLYKLITKIAIAMTSNPGFIVIDCSFTRKYDLSRIRKTKEIFQNISDAGVGVLITNATHEYEYDMDTRTHYGRYINDVFRSKNK